MKYITRIDSGYTHCYFVRAGYFKGSNSKCFTDGVYGGKRKALAQAKLWRDQQVKKFKSIIGKRNPRRHYGKGWYMSTDKRKDAVYLNAVAQWWDDTKNKQRQKSFSVNRYGYRKAVQLAKQHYKFMTTGKL